MIDRQFGEITFECDGCEETFPSGEGEWGDAMSQFRQNGWKAEKIGDDWVHLCPTCKRKSQ